MAATTKKTTRLTGKALQDALYRADQALWGLGGRELTEAEDDEDYRRICDCGKWEFRDQEDEDFQNDDGLCVECYNEICAKCMECDGWHGHAEMSEEFPGLCTDCGCEWHQELATELREQIDELLGCWDGERGEIEALKAVLTTVQKANGQIG